MPSRTHPKQRRPKQRRHGEKGSVLIYIFIAIILLAALTFAISRGNREGSATIDRERADLHATQILDYVSMMRRAVQSMTINGARPQDLCFYAAGWGNADYDPVAGAPLECPDARMAVFGGIGGGATFQTPSDDILDKAQAAQPRYGAWYFTGSNSVTGVGTDGAGIENKELLVVLPYIRREVCSAINRRLQIPGAEIPPVDDANFSMVAPFTGSFVAGHALNTAVLDGRRTGCFAATTTPVSGSYVFYAVLIAR